MFGALIAVAIGIPVGLSIALAIQPTAQKAPETVSTQQQQFDDSSIPRANEGDSIPVIFGTREIRKHNVIEVGGYWSEEIEINA